MMNMKTVAYLLCSVLTLWNILWYSIAVFLLLSPLTGELLATIVRVCLVLLALTAACIAHYNTQASGLSQFSGLQASAWMVVVVAPFSKAIVQSVANLILSAQLSMSSESSVTGLWLLLRAFSVGLFSFGPVMACLGHMFGCCCKKAFRSRLRLEIWLVLPACALLVLHGAVHGSVETSLPKPGCTIPALMASLAAVVAAILAEGITAEDSQNFGKRYFIFNRKARAARRRALHSWGAALMVTAMALCVVIPRCSPCQHYDPPLDVAAGRYQLLFMCEARLGGFISVVEGVLADQFRYRILRVGHSIVGGEFVEPKEFAGQSVYTAFYLQQAVLAAAPPWDRNGGHGPRSLHIGLGVGTAVKGLQHAGVETDVMELHGEVLQAAQTYFNITPKGAAYTGDALAGVSGLVNQTYDYIIHDVFSGGFVPSPLTHNTFFWQLKSKMLPTGALAVNFVGDADHALEQLWCKLKLVFNHVRCFGDQEEARFKNYVLFASDGPLDSMEANVATLLKGPAVSWSDGARDMFSSLAKGEMQFELDSHQCAALLGGTASLNIGRSWIAAQTSGIDRLAAWVEAFKEQYAMARHHWIVMRKQLGDSLWTIY